MRVTFGRGIEAIFFAAVLCIIAAVITMVVHGTSLENPVKPKSLAEWDERDIEAMRQRMLSAIQVGPEDLEELGFEQPPGDETILPRDTLAYNDITSNLLNLLHHYYFVDEDRMLEDSIEYVDRGTGYIRRGQKIFAQYSLGHVAKHVKYLSALAKFRHLFPTNAVFDEDLNRMDNLVRRIFEEELPNVRYEIETFFDLLELHRLTGEERYLNYADALNTNLRWDGEAEAYAQLIQRKSPRTIKPQFMNSVVLLQHYAERGRPVLSQAARILYEGIINDTYAPEYRMFYTQGTTQRPGDARGTVLDTFNTMEQAITMLKMMDYYDATGDESILSIVEEIVSAISTGESELIDRQQGGFYIKYKETTSQYKEEEKRADANLMIYSALMRYLKYDTGIQDFVRNFFYFISEIMYDEEHNGFYSHYDTDWSPKPVGEVYELSLSDAILGARIFLDEEELFRELRARSS